MADSAEAEQTEGLVAKAGRPMPLNSKKLTGILLRQLARGLQIESTAGTSVAELRQLVEGQVEHRYYQVVLTEVEHGVQVEVQVCLRDADGTFLTVEPLLEATEPQDGTQETTGEDGETADTATLREALRAAEEAQAALQVEVNNLRQQLTQERGKYKQLWGLNCLQMAEFEQVLSEKEEELEGLRQKLPQELAQGGGSRPGSVASSWDEPGPPSSEGKSSSLTARRGRAPPVEMFSGEDSETTLEDWLPSLERAAEWNKWGEEERLIQLVVSLARPLPPMIFGRPNIIGGKGLASETIQLVGHFTG